ncbi:MAG: hypothetical protein J6565_08070 [Lactobacillus sp.]|nr:hypothetical protein [Lactobacillus sp.]
MKLTVNHVNMEHTYVSNFQKLRYKKDRAPFELSSDEIDKFLLEEVNDRLSITFIGNSVVTIPKQNIESLVFSK